MAQRQHVHLVDDLSGSDADETVRFSLDGTDYEMDLSTDNAEKLRSALSVYVQKGRKTPGPRGQKTNRRTPSTASASASTSPSARESAQQIRRWAQDNGFNPSSRGRITKSIIDAYNESR
jgi:hypothetical protein